MDGAKAPLLFSTGQKPSPASAHASTRLGTGQTGTGGAGLPTRLTAARPSLARCAESCAPSAIFLPTHEGAKRSQQTARSLQRGRPANFHRKNDPDGADVASTNPSR